MSRPARHRAGARLRGTIAALALCAAATAGAQTGAAPVVRDGATQLIDAVINHPAVARRISEWGLSTVDVQHDVAAMSPAERARLAHVLTRRWRTNESHSTQDLQAQFLVTMSLMRESRLFASVVSGNRSGLR